MQNFVGNFEDECHQYKIVKLDGNESKKRSGTVSEIERKRSLNSWARMNPQGIKFIFQKIKCRNR
jgi:hypothetical protein